MNSHYIKKATIFLLCLFTLTISTVGFVYADSAGNTGDGASNTSVITLHNPLKVNSIGELVQNFVEIFSYVVILGAVLAFIWVGLQFILARGNPAKMTELKGWLFWILIGVAVVIGARLIIQVVINTLAASGAVDQRTIQSAQNAAKGQ